MGFQLVDTMPNRAASDIDQGIIDAALVPIVDVFPDGRPGPAGRRLLHRQHRPGRQRFLYSKVPIEELGGVRIAVSDESKTSVKLLQVLLALKYQVATPELVSPQEEHEAFLLIGNRGLRQRRAARGFPHKYDLGEEWFNWTRLPFVFARWVARNDVDSKTSPFWRIPFMWGWRMAWILFITPPSRRENLLMLPRDIVDYVQASGTTSVCRSRNPCAFSVNTWGNWKPEPDFLRFSILSVSQGCRESRGC